MRICCSSKLDAIHAFPAFGPAMSSYSWFLELTILFCAPTLSYALCFLPGVPFILCSIDSDLSRAFLNKHTLVHTSALQYDTNARPFHLLTLSGCTLGPLYPSSEGKLSFNVFICSLPASGMVPHTYEILTKCSLKCQSPITAHRASVR